VGLAADNSAGRARRAPAALLWPLAVCVALLLAAALAHAPAARADVCTGGAPYEASGSSAALSAAVPFLGSPRWSKEVLPQWAETPSSPQWGDVLSYAWYRRATLFAASSAAAWWVIPGAGCGLANRGEGLEQEGIAYEPQVCILIYAELDLAGLDCQDPAALAGASAPVSVRKGTRELVAGFAHAAAGSIEVHLEAGVALLPATGGVYGGAVSASLGKALTASELPAPVARTPAAVVLVDQTGAYSHSEGPLASTPRLKHVAAVIHARVRSVKALLLGTAVAGKRARDEVLYAPRAHALGARVARALHAHPARPLTGGALDMFGSVARVVVLVGKAE
jgi:hypothetical protein